MTTDPTRYRTIAADPPWPFEWRGGGARRTNGRGESHRNAMASVRSLPYRSMTVEEIAALPVSDLAAPDAHLYAGGWGCVMPDPQIRTWTIEGWDYNTLSHGRITDGKRLDQGERVRVVEWDRGRVVPIIERTLMDHERSTDYLLTAEDVFDALNGKDKS